MVYGCNVGAPPVVLAESTHWQPLSYWLVKRGLFRHTTDLSGEGQGDTQLVDRLGQLQGVEGGTQAQSHAGSQLLGVGQGGQTGVGDLSLDESGGVQLVLGGELNVDVGGLDGVPGGLGTGLDQRRNLVVVSSGEDRQVGGGGHGNGVQWVGVADTDGVLVELGGGNVVTQLGTGGEAVVGNGQVSGGNRALEQVEEQAGVDGGLLVEEVQLGVLGAVGHNGGVQLTLEAWSQQLGQLKLGAQGVGVVPALGQGQAGGLVGVLGLHRGGNGIVLRGLALDGESDTVRSGGLDVHGSGAQVEEVLGKQVVGRLLDVGESNRGHGEKKKVLVVGAVRKTWMRNGLEFIC